MNLPAVCVLAFSCFALRQGKWICPSSWEKNIYTQLMASCTHCTHSPVQPPNDHQFSIVYWFIVYCDFDNTSWGDTKRLALSNGVRFGLTHRQSIYFSSSWVQRNIWLDCTTDENVKRWRDGIIFFYFFSKIQVSHSQRVTTNFREREWRSLNFISISRARNA